MKNTSKEEKASYINKFPYLEELDWVDYEDEISETYNIHEICVKEGGFHDAECGETEVLNINPRIAQAFSKIPNTVNLTYYDKIPEWNEHLKSFYRSLWKNTQLISFIADDGSDEDDPDIHFYTFDSESEFGDVINNAVNNLYTSDEDGDWDEQTMQDAFDGKKDFNSLMIGLEGNLRIIMPELNCILVESEDKTILCYTTGEIPELVTTSAKESGLYVYESKME